MAICSNCGKEISDTAKFCKFCGTKIQPQINEVSNENFETMVIPPVNTQDGVQPAKPIFEEIQSESVARQDSERVSAETVAVAQREPFNTGAPVYNFNEGKTGDKNIQPPSENKKRRKKSQKQKIILSVIAVLLVVAIALTGVLIYKKLTTTDEEKLRTILAEQTSKPVIEFYCKDYDENDTYEAYAVVSGLSEKGSKEYKEADIYYVDADGAQLIQQNVDGRTNGIISTDKRLFVSFEIVAENGKTLSYIYTADGENPAESEISGKYSQVHQENNKVRGIDDLGNTIDIEFSDEIKDVVLRGNNNKNEIPEETTTEAPVVDNYDSDLETYKQYFSNGGLWDIVFDFYDTNEVTIESCMIDMNGDGTYELLMKAVHAGYEIQSGVFAIQEGNVEKLHNAYSGGTGGGSFHSICKDTLTGEYFIKVNSFVRDGYFAGEGHTSFLIYDGQTIAEPKNFESGSFEIDYYDLFDKLKQETTVYSVEDNRVTWYKVEGVYVTESEYDNAMAKYSDQVSPEYEMKQGTFADPMPY